MRVDPFRGYRRAMGPVFAREPGFTCESTAPVVNYQIELVVPVDIRTPQTLVHVEGRTMPGSQSFCRRSLPGWQTTFGRWVGDIGVPGIVSALKPNPDLRVTPTCIYQWLKGHQPRPARAQALVEMSAGQLTLDAVYGHRRELRELRTRETDVADQRTEKNL